MSNEDGPVTLSVSFRGTRIELVADGPDLTVRDVRAEVLRRAGADPATRLSLICQGRRLEDCAEAPVREALERVAGRKRLYKLMATGVSSLEAQALDDQMRAAQRTLRVRDDLTERGRAGLEERRVLGQYMMQKADRKLSQDSSPYCFGRIETLPNLPDEEKAREILTTLANDPGVLACLRAHRWKVGALAELYPDGKVGQSAVCVMGLNENKGQRILLRVRTDDLRGFRKMASIRKVLYHELAHNVHSEHDDSFFQLMRQVERECTSMDWTHGSGLSRTAVRTTLYTGGTYRLGGEVLTVTDQVETRELAARAALARMTQEEKEIEQSCGCGRTDVFLPKQPPHDAAAKDDEHLNSS